MFFLMLLFGGLFCLFFVCGEVQQRQVVAFLPGGEGEQFPSWYRPTCSASSFAPISTTDTSISLLLVTVGRVCPATAWGLRSIP